MSAEAGGGDASRRGPVLCRGPPLVLVSRHVMSVYIVQDLNYAVYLITAGLLSPFY